MAGVVQFTVGRMHGNTGLPKAGIRTSGQYSSQATATNIEDGSGDISLQAGELFRIFASPASALRIEFGGGTATATTGWHIAANTARDFIIEPGMEGAVSVIDT